MYGAIFAAVVGYFTDGRFDQQIVYEATAVYAALGFVLEAWVGDLIALTMHLVLGVLSGMLMVFGNQFFDPQPELTGVARALFVLGIGTGIVVYLWWRYH